MGEESVGTVCINLFLVVIFMSHNHDIQLTEHCSREILRENWRTDTDVFHFRMASGWVKEREVCHQIVEPWFC